MEQQTLFDVERGRHLRDEGMAQASAAMKAQMWRVEASAWLDEQPAGIEFTADDVTMAIGTPSVGINQNNAIGGWFSAQARQGRIVFTGRQVKSMRVTRHINQNRVWRVL